MRMGGPCGESQEAYWRYQQLNLGKIKKTAMIPIQCSELHQKEGWEEQMG
jgi:hypothetical protein